LVLNSLGGWADIKKESVALHPREEDCREDGATRYDGKLLSSSDDQGFQVLGPQTARLGGRVDVCKRKSWVETCPQHVEGSKKQGQS